MDKRQRLKLFYLGMWYFMNHYFQASHLLTRKKNLFLQLEEVTGNMSLLQVEELLISTEQRGLLLEEINELDMELKAYYLQDPLLKSAITHSCNKSQLPPQLAELYDISLTVKAIANRILKNDENIKIHLNFEKERILSKIQQLNTSGDVVASKYHRSVQTGRSNPLGVSKNKFI